ncbi:M23 family metallopeptidase [Mesorhizobium sp. M0199]|uniref:M23 family metallopeptidase n=1 Tax=Mesorhizobium sp. M0199 TaxID=2956911 RepID=UPI00333729B9
MDCRPDAPVRGQYEAVAFADGIVTQVTSNTTVVVSGPNGTVCRYLHLAGDSIKVKRGDGVKAGQTVIGKVSSVMGGNPHGTSIHLHFDCSQVVSIGGAPRRVYIPIYTSMVAAYARALGISVSVTGGKLASGTIYERP